MAEVPDGPPVRFRWRRLSHAVATPKAPNASPWNGGAHQKPQPTRDYYRVEDQEGRRFWLYRDGLYERETDRPRWYRARAVRMTRAHAYAELAVATNFSFLRGASHPQELVVAATLSGPPRDRHRRPQQLAGVVRAYAALRSARSREDRQPKLLVGARLVFTRRTPDILAYPMNRASYGRLCRLLSRRQAAREERRLHAQLRRSDRMAGGLLLAIIPPRRTIRQSSSRKSGGRTAECQSEGVRWRASQPVNLKTLLHRLTEMAPGPRLARRIHAASWRRQAAAERSAQHCPRMPRAAARDQRRALSRRRSGGSCRTSHLHPRACDARTRRDACSKPMPSAI